MTSHARIAIAARLDVGPLGERKAAFGTEFPIAVHRPGVVENEGVSAGRFPVAVVVLCPDAFLFGIKLILQAQTAEQPAIFQIRVTANVLAADLAGNW